MCYKPDDFEDFATPRKVERNIIVEDSPMNEPENKGKEFGRQNQILDMYQLKADFENRRLRMYLRWWRDSLPIRIISAIKYGDLSVVERRSNREFRTQLFHNVKSHITNYEVMESFKCNFGENNVYLDKIKLKTNEVCVIRQRTGFLGYGEFGEMTKINPQKLGELMKLRKTKEPMILEGIEKNIYGCLINLLKLCTIPINEMYYMQIYRSFILLQKVGDTYHEVNTKYLRICEYLKICKVYTSKIHCHFKRTKTPLKPYGKLFYNLCEGHNQENLPDIHTYEEVAKWSIEDLKKRFWIKVYGRNDSRNKKRGNVVIIRNCLWNYTELISCDSYLYSTVTANFALDKTRRHKTM